MFSQQNLGKVSGGVPLVCQLSGLGNCLFKVWVSYQKCKSGQEKKGELSIGEGGGGEGGGR